MLKGKALLRVLCLLLALLCFSSSVGCDFGAVLPSGLFDKDGEGEGDGDGDGSLGGEIEEVVKDVFEGSYRDQLNKNETAVYDAVTAAKAGIYHFNIPLAEPLVLCSGREPNEAEQNEASSRVSFWVTNALYAAWLDCPRLFWMETGNYSYNYTMVPDENGVYRILEIQVEVESRIPTATAESYEKSIHALLSTLSLGKSSDYETVVAINDYLCDAITYADTANRQNIFGALIEGRCVCEGYAHAFKLLCDRFGVECASIIGTGISNGKSEGHMWNAVRIDGAWYAVDVTWNDQEDERAQDKFLLVGKDTVVFDERFGATHLAEYTRGTSKVFASPAISSAAYQK